MLLGIDLGGTKIEAAVLANDGSELFRQRVATPSASYQGILAAIADLVQAAQGTCASMGSVGLCSPGVLVPETGLIKNANTVCLNGKPLAADLTRRLAKPVLIENDANCFALSEATDGAGAGFGSVFGVILGTGAGGGLIIHGRLHRGANGIAGEWGHNPLPRQPGEVRPARPCYCGRVDCIETYVSGPGFSETYRDITGHVASAEHIAVLLQQQDAGAARAFARYVQQLAMALAGVINVVDPDVIVLGGGISKMQAIYPLLSRQLAAYVFSETIRTQVLPPKYGDASGVRGAAWLNLRPDVLRDHGHLPRRAPDAS